MEWTDFDSGHEVFHRLQTHAEEWRPAVLTFETTELSKGIHLASIVGWTPEDWVQFGTQFSLVLQEAYFLSESRPDQSGTTRLSGPSGVRREGSDVLLYGDDGPDEMGELPVRLRLEDTNGDAEFCAGYSQEFYLIALLDGIQIPVGDLGHRPHFELRQGERIELATTFRNLPVDHHPHDLQLWLLPGANRFHEEPNGGPTLWHASPRGIAYITWPPTHARTTEVRP